MIAAFAATVSPSNTYQAAMLYSFATDFACSLHTTAEACAADAACAFTANNVSALLRAAADAAATACMRPSGRRMRAMAHAHARMHPPNRPLHTRRSRLATAPRRPTALPT